MKNWMKVLLALMLAATCMVACVACDIDLGLGGGGDKDNDNDVVNPGEDDGEEGKNPEEKPDDSEFMENAWQIKFHYSYTAQIVNENDRTENKQADITVATIYVPYDEAANGWTAELLAKKDAITYHGYKFDAWYLDWDKTAKPQAPVGDPYDFANATIDKDIHLYAYKGDIAGDDINWDIAFDYETIDAIVPADVPETSAVVKFVYTDVLDKLSNNVVSNIALKALLVDKTAGWTNDAITAKDAIRYNGYALTWYTVEGEEYKFDAAPAENLTLYGKLGALDAVPKKTETTFIGGVLNIVGEGKMFGYNDANSIDVPWYDYKDKITQIVISDGITDIGKNAFANFEKLKSVKFGEGLINIGENAFYKSGDTSFRTLRLPSTVKYIAKQAFANTKLREVVLNEGFETIGESAFSGSHMISSVVVPTSLKKVDTGAFFAGSKTTTHLLSKVYYMGADAASFAANVEIGLDNEAFKDFAALYCYKEKEDNMEEVSGLYWYFYDVNGTKYPAQYSYALKYMVGTNKVPVFTDYVPVTAKIVDGAPVFDVSTGMPIFEGAITASNMENFNKILNAEKILDGEGNTVLDLGFGFLEITGINGIAEGTLVTSDKALKCVRGTYASSGSNTGILGGGITWTLTRPGSGDKDSTVTIKPGTGATDTNMMWNFKQSPDATVLWFDNSTKAPNVTKIVIEEGVKSIGNYVFADTGIEEIVIPASVTEIAPEAFVNCSSLLSIYYMGSELHESFTKLNNLATVYAMTDAATAEDGAYWLENDAKKKIAWTLKDGALYIGGDAEMVNFETASAAPWFGAKDEITSVTVARNITSLGENMVSGYTKVAKVSLPAVLRKIPMSALENTYIVNQTPDYAHGMLVIDGHLIKVDAARRNNEFFALTTDINNIADGAFSRCDEIKTLFVPNTVQNINEGAFDDVALEKIYIDNNSATWSNIANFDWSHIAVFYRGQWYINSNGQYASNVCNHVYEGEWHVDEEATCVKEGVQSRPCYFGCGVNETAVIEIDANKHNVVDGHCTNTAKDKDGNDIVCDYTE